MIAIHRIGEASGASRLACRKKQPAFLDVGVRRSHRRTERQLIDGGHSVVLCDCGFAFSLTVIGDTGGEGPPAGHAVKQERGNDREEQHDAGNHRSSDAGGSRSNRRVDACRAKAPAIPHHPRDPAYEDCTPKNRTTGSSCGKRDHDQHGGNRQVDKRATPASQIRISCAQPAGIQQRSGTALASSRPPRVAARAPVSVRSRRGWTSAEPSMPKSPIRAPSCEHHPQTASLTIDPGVGLEPPL